MILEGIKVLQAIQQPDKSFLYTLDIPLPSTRDEIQKAINEKLDIGSHVRISGGTIPVRAPIVVDYSDAQFNSPRINFSGEGNESTYLMSSAPGQHALKVFGGPGEGQVNQGVYSDFQILRGADSALGMSIVNTAGIKLNNVTLYGLGLYLEGTQISTFENVHFKFGEIGVLLKQPDKFVTPFDSLSWNQCGFMGKRWGMQGGQIANMCLFQSRVEGCGLASGSSGPGGTSSGVPGHGGLDLHFGTIPGTSHFALDWGPGLNMAYGWVENNCGEADVILTNDGTSTMVHTITGVPFSRVGKNNWSTNCIKVRNPNGGRTILNLQGCAFAGFNDYQPDESRQYVDADDGTEVICDGCTFASKIEQGKFKNR